MCRRRSAWSTTSISWRRAASSPKALPTRSARAPSPSSTSSSTANPRARCRSTMPRPTTAPISSWPLPDMQIVAALRQRLERLGANVTSHVWRLGFASRFLGYLVMHSGTALRRFRLTIAEIYFAGVLSLIIILVSGLFVGMVLALQGYDTLQRFGASESLGVLVALSLVRELGPVVAGLLFASRAGSAITAEIGLMKATEQLSAMEMMAVDPVARVVAPRFWGGVISMPLLAALFSAMGIFGGYLVGVQLIGVDAGAFWSQMQAAVDLRNDIVNGIIKSVVFGIAVTWIAVFEGYDARRPRRACRAPRRARWLPRRSPFSRSISCSPHSCSPEEVTDNEPLGYRSVGRNLRRGGPCWVAVSRAQGRQPRLLQHRAGLPGVCQVRQYRRPEGARAGEERRRGDRQGRRHPLRQ